MRGRDGSAKKRTPRRTRQGGRGDQTGCSPGGRRGDGPGFSAGQLLAGALQQWRHVLCGLVLLPSLALFVGLHLDFGLKKKNALLYTENYWSRSIRSEIGRDRARFG